MQRPFRFGVVSGGLTSPDAWVPLARRVEELGYASLLMPDRPSIGCLLYTSPSPRDRQKSRMPSSA